MAPVTGSSKKKGFLRVMAEEGEKAVSRLLNRKHKAAITKRKTRRGETTREHGLRNFVNRGMNVAMGAYGLAKKTAGLGGVQGVLADAMVRTTGALLGIQSTQHVGASISAGWNVKCETVREDGRRSFSLSIGKTPESCEGQEFKSRLEFKSPANDFVRTPAEGGYRLGGGNSVHKQMRKPPYSRLTFTPDRTSSFSPGGSAASHTVSTSTPQQLPPPLTLPFGHHAHSRSLEPKAEPGTPSEFETIPLSPLQAEPKLNRRIKRESIKREAQY